MLSLERGSSPGAVGSWSSAAGITERYSPLGTGSPAVNNVDRDDFVVATSQRHRRSMQYDRDNTRSRSGPGGADAGIGRMHTRGPQFLQAIQEAAHAAGALFILATRS